MNRPRGPVTDPHALAALFATHRLRCTSQRRALYLALASTDKHPTADALHRSLAAQQNISLATVYNALQALCDAGLAIKIAGDGYPARYDATTHDHLHLRDTRTGQVSDLPEDLSAKILAHLPREILDELQHRTGFKLHRLHIELVGEKTPD